MRRTLALVLAGGEGRRLAPLTEERSKPAVHFGGRYRLIDFVLSNLVNSGVDRTKVLVQYRSSSLTRHISRAWPISSGVLDQYIDIVPAAMNLGPQWFQGTADAIYQNLDLLRGVDPDDVLIFGADHIYKMDVSLMLEQHRDTRAGLTVATLAVPREEATGFGCVAVDAEGRVTGFVEKPADPPGIPGREHLALASMGNYIFRRDVLLDELRRDAGRDETSHDFGKDILSTAFERTDVYAYDFSQQLCPGEAERSRGYWKDVGTIDNYFEASMDLVNVEPKLNLYNPEWPILGMQSALGPAKFVFSDVSGARVGQAHDSIVGSGAIVSGGTLGRSVVSHGARINSFAQVNECVLFPFVDVGRGARLSRCIVDKGVRVPADTIIGEDPEEDAERFTVSEGGVVVVARKDFGQVDAYDRPPRTT
jgi:glucose-1-phosphate adenylyltransferase